jgi:hypothetical protein
MCDGLIKEDLVEAIGLFDWDGVSVWGILTWDEAATRTSW